MNRNQLVVVLTADLRSVEKVVVNDGHESTQIRAEDVDPNILGIVVIGVRMSTEDGLNDGVTTANSGIQTCA